MAKQTFIKLYWRPSHNFRIATWEEACSYYYSSSRITVIKHARASLRGSWSKPESSIVDRPKSSAHASNIRAANCSSTPSMGIFNEDPAWPLFACKTSARCCFDFPRSHSEIMELDSFICFPDKYVRMKSFHTVQCSTTAKLHFWLNKWFSTTLCAVTNAKQKKFKKLLKVEKIGVRWACQYCANKNRVSKLTNALLCSGGGKARLVKDETVWNKGMWEPWKLTKTRILMLFQSLN